MFKNQDKREREKQMAKKKIELSHHDTRRDVIKGQAIIALYVNQSFCPKQAASNRTFCQLLGFFFCSIGWVALSILCSTHEICSYWPLGAYTLEEALT